MGRGGALFAEEKCDTTEQIDKSGRTNNEKMELARKEREEGKGKRKLVPQLFTFSPRLADSN